MADEIDKRRRRLIAGTALGMGVIGVGGVSWAAYRAATPDYNMGGYHPWKIRPEEMNDRLFAVACGTLAASPHNTQPWRFQIENDHIAVYADRQRHVGDADPEYRLMLQGIGCAIENIAVSAGAVGYRVQSEIVADERFHKDGLCALVRLKRSDGAIKSPRYAAIFERRTNRLAYDSSGRFPREFYERLMQPGSIGRSDISFLEAPNTTERVGRITRQSVRAYLADGRRHEDGVRYFRLSREEWTTKRDGISLYTSGAPALMKAWTNWVADRGVLKSDTFVQGEIDAVDQTCTDVPVWALIHGDGQSPTRWVQAGRLLERLYLDATVEDLSVCPVAYPTELPATRRMLRSAFQLAPDREPLALVRLGVGDPVERSVRRPVAEVIDL